ncbi:MAG: alpha/beta fold hydrolase [Alphaproteobacteria bacterium]|nr:alpha/beta fold hydrolase [Alphaproteobacteria bacterium]
MPVLPSSQYAPPVLLRNGHAQTIFPVLFRNPPPVRPRTERMETPDGDFLDLDWHQAGRQPSNRLAIVSHGLEGNSRRKYVLGMVTALNRRGWDVLAWTMRGCGHEPNRLLPSYHSGFTDDLRHLFSHVLNARDKIDVALGGFFIGANQILKYLGEEPERVPPQVARAVAISVPCDLSATAIRMKRAQNRIYTEYLLRSLRRKIWQKSERFRSELDVSGLDAISTFDEFDERYTAPMHGFAGSAEYYRLASCKPFLEAVRVPSLILNATDDPMLSPESIPHAEATANPNLFLETPKHGGHVGFVDFANGGEYYSEYRACEFLDGGSP